MILVGKYQFKRSKGTMGYFFQTMDIELPNNVIQSRNVEEERERIKGRRASRRQSSLV